MDSETSSNHVEDSDDSLLDIRELNDAEFDLPSIVPPSLESILWDLESRGSSDNVSEHSHQSGSAAGKVKSMLYHSILQGISAQVKSAESKVGAGSPTAISNCGVFVSVGTSHGYLLTFDAEQKLCWCCHDAPTLDQGAISALAFNEQSTRLLVGFERGYILQVDAHTGDVLRRLPTDSDAHAPHSAVLQLRYCAQTAAQSTPLALVGDSSGCVFQISLARRLGVRSTRSRCLFSGARGEVCTFEPLLEMGSGPDGGEVIVGIATLSKVIVITIKPRLRVLYSQQLPRCATALPLLAWQLVLVGKSWQPVLCWARGSELNYTRLVRTSGKPSKIVLIPLRQVQLPYTLASLHWLGPRHLALLDTSEHLRLIDVRTQHELECIDVTAAGLVYASAHFKALAVGAPVSPAFALAAEHACYNTLASRSDQLLVLGTRHLHLVKLRTWHERLVYLSKRGCWTEALRIAAAEGGGGGGGERVAAVDNLLGRYIDMLQVQSNVDWDALSAAVGCCIKLNKTDLLCNQLWDAIAGDKPNREWYLALLADYICQGAISTLSPAISQSLICYLDHKYPINNNNNNKLQNGTSTTTPAVASNEYAASTTRALSDHSDSSKQVVTSDGSKQVLTNDSSRQVLPNSDLVTVKVNHSPIYRPISDSSMQVLTSDLVSIKVNDEPICDDHMLRQVLLSLDLTCLDLDQALRICKARRYYDVWIHITTKTIGDYAGPLVEFLGELTPGNHQLGNTLLLYVSASLSGYGHPYGIIPPSERTRVKYDILRCLETVHSPTDSPDREPPYPYLRALLAHNTRECLNVIGLAFGEQAEFAGEMGAVQRLRMVEIMMAVVRPPQFDSSQITTLACFVARLVTDNQLKLTQMILDGVIKALTNTSGQPLSKRDHNEREQAWLDLLLADKLQHIPKGQLLNGALESRCYKVAEYLYELSGDFDQILRCYLLDNEQNNESNPSAVFGYIRQHINTHMRCIRKQFQQHFLQLLRINAKATVEILLEHYLDELDRFCTLVETDEDCQFVLLRGLVYNYEKVSLELSEKYLELACKRNDADVENFVQMRMCDVTRALDITQRYKKERATAILLETNGEYKAALTILLNLDLVPQAQSLCIRATDQLDMATTQSLWLQLLQHCQASDKVTLRDLVHDAAPYIPPEQLLDLVTGANMGDVRGILNGVFQDYQRDIDMLKVTVDILGNDLHHSLAKRLYSSTAGFSVVRLTCDMCRRPFCQPPVNYDSGSSTEPNDIVLFGCGHAYHQSCCSVSAIDDASTSTSSSNVSNDSGHGSINSSSNVLACCIQCNVKTAVLEPQRNLSKKKVTVDSSLKVKAVQRPDLEGHF